MNKNSLKRTALIGGFSFLGSNALLLSLSLITHVVLGRQLSHEEFGVYGLAAGVFNSLLVLNDGGLRLWVAQRNPEDLRGELGPAFLISFGFSVFACAILMAAAPLAGLTYGDPRVGLLIAIMALSGPIAAYSVVASGWMQANLRLGALAAVRTLVGTTTYVGTICLAVLGFGVFSPILPALGAAALGSVLTAAITRLNPIRVRAARRQVLGMLKETTWALGGTLVLAIQRNVDYLILGLVTNKAVVGVYFFSYQLTARGAWLINETLRPVILPTLSSLKNSDEEKTAYILTIYRFIGLVGPLGFFWLALLFEDVQELLWGDAWLAAVIPVQILAVAMPFQALALLSESFCQALGFFTKWTKVTLTRTLVLSGVLLSAGVMGWMESPDAACGVVGGYLIISGTGQAWWLMRVMGVPVRGSLGSFLFPYLVMFSWLLLSRTLPVPVEPASLTMAIVLRTVVFLSVAVGLVWLMLGEHGRKLTKALVLRSRQAGVGFLDAL